MKRPLLVVDVGNTATNMAVADAWPLRHRPRFGLHWTLSTRLLQSPRLFERAFRKKLVFRLSRAEWTGAVVSSVVPSVNAGLSRVLTGVLGVRPHFVNARVQRCIKVLYRHPEEIGADRIVNARAVLEITSRPCIVVDFGTATTFDCVDKRGAFLGGVIAPGPVISAEALYTRTAKLPLVALEKPVRIMGRSTLECIQAGLFHGYRGLVREIVLQLKTVLGPRTAVLSTGGQARWILRGLDIIDDNIPDLTLMGLYFMWHDTQKRGSKLRRTL